MKKIVIISILYSFTFLYSQNIVVSANFLSIERYDEKNNMPLSDRLPIDFTFTILKWNNDKTLDIKMNRGRMDIPTYYVVDSIYTKYYRKADRIYVDVTAKYGDKVSATLIFLDKDNFIEIMLFRYKVYNTYVGTWLFISDRY